MDATFGGKGEEKEINITINYLCDKILYKQE